MSELSTDRSALHVGNPGSIKVRKLSRKGLLSALGEPDEIEYDPESIRMVEGAETREIVVALLRPSAVQPGLGGAALRMSVGSESPLRITRVELTTDKRLPSDE